LVFLNLNKASQVFLFLHFICCLFTFDDWEWWAIDFKTEWI